MCGRTNIFQLLSREDVSSNEMDLGVTVLSSLGGTGSNDLYWSVVDDGISSLLDGTCLNWVCLASYLKERRKVQTSSFFLTFFNKKKNNQKQSKPTSLAP